MQCRCLFFLSLTLFVGLSNAQMLVLDLSATTVTAGERLTANCTATTSTAGRTLFLNGENVVDLITDGRLANSTDSSDGLTTTWIIDPVQRQDAGEYLCSAGGGQGSHTDSLPQTVTVYFSPNATIAVPAASVLSGESAEVVVTIEALPAITGVQFSLPSAQAEDPSHSAVNVTSGDVTLTFSPVDRYYNGMYTANFTNGVGSGTVAFELTVYFGPYFSYEGEEQVDGASIDVTFARGQEVILVCEVSATNPTVFSLGLMRPIADNVDFDEGTGTITITGATAANEGTYTCTADNGETSPTTISFVLRMDQSPSGTTSAPTTDSAENLLATVSVAVVMLLSTIFLS